MNVDTLIKFFAAAVMVVLFSGCASFFKKTFIKPKVSYESMLIEKIEPSGATVRLFLSIENKNNLDFNLSHMDHTVYLEGKKLFDTTVNDNILIKARDKTIVEFPLNISFLDLHENLVSLWEKKKIKYNIDSKITLDTVVGKLPFNVKYEDFLELPPVPDLSVENIKIDSMTFTQITMQVDLKILNNDKLQLNVDELYYEIFFNEFEIAKGSMEPALFVQSQSVIDLSIPVNLRLLSLKKSITDILKKGEVQYDIHVHIKGKSSYGEYILPLDKSGMQKLF